MRPIQALISHNALQHNLNIVKQCAPNAKVMAVLKADAYGHGLMNVAHGLSDADGFALLNATEAIELREAGFEQTILLLEGFFSTTEMRIATSFHLDVVVHCVQQIEMLESVKLIKPINVHLKMNSGMNRLGFAPSEYLTAFNRLTASSNVADVILMTHFATADNEVGITLPLQLFQETTKGLSQTVSLANSATILRHTEAHADWVRPGIMLYGASPIGGTPATDFGLKPAMQLNAEIIAIQTLEKGDKVGYGNRFVASKKMRVGIVACGYADGYPRHTGQYTAADQHGTIIALNGKLIQTLGRVSMDMMVCDLSNTSEANIGAQVELWGNTVPVDTVAEACETVGYELLCAVAPRVPKKILY